MDKPLTTGEIARICQVSQATVLNWIRDRGLKAYATPGGHYRVLPADLRAFAEQYNMPIDLPSSNGTHDQPA
jgi:excisionase family DNA binding protein